MSTKYYLARNQKTFGPLTEQEVESLRQSGQISQYTWIFQEGQTEWAPIDPPPALPLEVRLSVPTSVGQAPSHSHALPAASRLRAVAPKHRLERDAYRVILFDHRNAISGWLETASDGGCEIRSDQRGSDPLFVAKEAACLTLHDTRTGESIKLRVRISDIGRAERGWAYQLQWNEAPALLHRSAERSQSSVAA